jgi:hypothetical protein
MFETLVRIGVFLVLEGLASALVLARIALSNTANVCRCTGLNHNEFVVSLIREIATLQNSRSKAL